MLIRRHLAIWRSCKIPQKPKWTLYGPNSVIIHAHTVNKLNVNKTYHEIALQRHVWSTFNFSEIRSELTYDDLRIVWLQMHSVPLKPTIRWILRKGLPIAQIGFQAFQMHVWSTFDSSKIGSELTYNDLRIVWLKMQCEMVGLNMLGGLKTSETREGWLKVA